MKSKTSFTNRKWNYPSRKWNCFFYFQTSDEKTSLKQCLPYLLRSQNPVLQTANGIIQTDNGIISPIPKHWIERLFFIKFSILEKVTKQERAVIMKTTRHNL